MSEGPFGLSSTGGKAGRCENKRATSPSWQVAYMSTPSRTAGSPQGCPPIQHGVDLRLIGGLHVHAPGGIWVVARLQEVRAGLRPSPSSPLPTNGNGNGQGEDVGGGEKPSCGMRYHDAHRGTPTRDLRISSNSSIPVYVWSIRTGGGMNEDVTGGGTPNKLKG